MLHAPLLAALLLCQGGDPVRAAAQRVDPGQPVGQIVGRPPAREARRQQRPCAADIRRGTARPQNQRAGERVERRGHARFAATAITPRGRT